MEAAFGRLHNSGAGAFGARPTLVESMILDGGAADMAIPDHTRSDTYMIKATFSGAPDLGNSLWENPLLKSLEPTATLQDCHTASATDSDTAPAVKAKYHIRDRSYTLPPRLGHDKTHSKSNWRTGRTGSQYRFEPAVWDHGWSRTG